MLSDSEASPLSKAEMHSRGSFTLFRMTGWFLFEQIAPSTVITNMNRHQISVTKDEQTYNFEVADLPHHDNGHCKFEVFKDDQLVAGFEPDGQQILHICQNTGTVDEEILHLLADEIERYTWYAAD